MRYPKTNLLKPCNDCPFRVKSLPGWLGPWKVADLHRFVMSEQPFSCHQTVTHDDQPVEETELCVGSILYLNKNCKVARPGKWIRLQQERLDAEDTMGILDGHQFLQRHQDGLQRIT